jgi:hypothetical protein
MTGGHRSPRGEKDAATDPPSVAFSSTIRPFPFPLETDAATNFLADETF